jgi:hypothetical protein
LPVDTVILGCPLVAVGTTQGYAWRFARRPLSMPLLSSRIREVLDRT